MLLGTDILKEVISLLAVCPDCESNTITITSDPSKKKGLSVFLNFECLSCKWKKSFYTSKEINSDSRGQSPSEVNLRAVIAMRKIGKGHTALNAFCGFMNISPPMQTKAFYDIQSKIYNAYEQVANSSMVNAADEYRKSDEICENDNNDAIVDIAVSCDGTWQKRGYSSLNGVVTVIGTDTGKCLDYRVKSKQCSACSSWESRKDTEEYENFISTHDCLINHTGSAGLMEADGVVECFAESVEKRKLRYVNYLGDGDTKSFSEVVKSDPYPGITVQILECVGNIQKRWS